MSDPTDVFIHMCIHVCTWLCSGLPALKTSSTHACETSYVILFRYFFDVRQHLLELKLEQLGHLLWEIMLPGLTDQSFLFAVLKSKWKFLLAWLEGVNPFRLRSSCRAHDGPNAEVNVGTLLPRVVIFYFHGYWHNRIWRTNSEQVVVLWFHTCSGAWSYLTA